MKLSAVQYSEVHFIALQWNEVKCCTVQCSGYKSEKSEDNSNPIAKINIEEQKRDFDHENYFNEEKDAEEEEDVFYLEADSENKDEEDDEN